MYSILSDHTTVSALAREAQVRLHSAFRPKTTQAYTMLFRIFIAFCICCSLSINKVTLVHILAYMEFLAKNNVSVPMLANHISALKAKFTLYDLNFQLLDHPKVKYFLRSMKLNRPLVVSPKNIMSLDTLTNLVRQCDHIYAGQIFKSIFLIAFFGFLRISNLAPHAVKDFDSSRHLTLGDVSFSKNYMKLIIKWSKTMQTRDAVHVLTLPRLRGSKLCPVAALRRALQQYQPLPQDPLFQINTSSGWQVITDSRIRKTLSRLNEKMGFSKHHFTFHTFQRSGASLAYNSHVPIQKIKQHGSWTSECVWRYIQENNTYSKDIADSFAQLIQS